MKKKKLRFLVHSVSRCMVSVISMRKTWETFQCIPGATSERSDNFTFPEYFGYFIHKINNSKKSSVWFEISAASVK